MSLKYYPISSLYTFFQRSAYFPHFFLFWGSHMSPHPHHPHPHYYHQHYPYDNCQHHYHCPHPHLVQYSPLFHLNNFWCRFHVTTEDCINSSRMGNILLVTDFLSVTILYCFWNLVRFFGKLFTTFWEGGFSNDYYLLLFFFPPKLSLDMRNWQCILAWLQVESTDCLKSQLPAMYDCSLWPIPLSSTRFLLLLLLVNFGNLSHP